MKLHPVQRPTRKPRLLRALRWADDRLPDWLAALFVAAGIVYLIGLFFP